MSSTIMTVFLTETSGMSETPGDWRHEARKLRAFDDPSFTLQAEGSRMNQSRAGNPAREYFSGIQGVLDFSSAKRADVAGHEALTQIAVRSEVAGRLAHNRGMSRQVHRVGNQGRGRVCRRGGGSQNRDCVSDSQRKASPPPAAGRDSSHRQI
jgi:hypothetical protein